MFAIAAVALTAVFTFASCEKNDDPVVKPEEKILPIDSITATLAYEFSEAVLKLYDLKYEVTDFNGKKETIAVTGPGSVKKVYKTTDVNAKVSAKLIPTYKNNIDDIKTDSIFIKFHSAIDGAMYVNGKMIELDHDDSGKDLPEGLMPKEDLVEIITSFESRYNYSMFLIDEFKKGVTETWFNKYCESH